MKIIHAITKATLYEAEVGTIRELVEAAVTANTDLRYSNLSGSNLSGSNLSSSNLRGSNLRGSNLRCSDLSYSDLSYSNLSGSNLRYSNLSYSNLSGAKGITPERFTPLRMLYDQPGAIRAYKLVASNGEGPYNGGIKYEIGQSYSVENAGTDETVQCAAGINLATLDWCLHDWKDGYRVLIAEFTADDIAAIPHGTDGKFRVRRCKIVGEKDVSGMVRKEVTA